MEAFLERAPPQETAKHIQERQKYLLAGLLGQSLVGQYSLLHDKSVYALGYRDPCTIYAAYMCVILPNIKLPLLIYSEGFCIVLDGSKTGLRVKKDVFRADMNNPKLYGKPPEWRKFSKP